MPPGAHAAEILMTTLKALEIWTAQAICDAGIALSIIALLLHVARAYFERILSRLTLRVAADIGWLTYVALRDGSLFLSAVAGLWTLNLDLMADIKIGLPFVPLATVVTCATLLWKVFGNAEDPRRAHRVDVALTACAACLNAIGYAVVMEGPGDEYRAASSHFWKGMVGLRSNTNPELATLTFYITSALLFGIAALAVVASLRTLEPRNVRS
jgi:hypothetical protein